MLAPPIRWLQWRSRWRSEQIARSYATPDEDIEPADARKLPPPPREGRHEGRPRWQRLQDVFPSDLVELCRREVSKRRSKAVKRSAGVVHRPDGSGALRARGGDRGPASNDGRGDWHSRGRGNKSQVTMMAHLARVLWAPLPGDTVNSGLHMATENCSFGGCFVLFFCSGVQALSIRSQVKQTWKKP